MLHLIVAYTKNHVIGKNNDMPWYLPADLKHFKEITDGHAVIMGRNTYDSILNRLGHGLPNRKNIVLTRTPQASTDDSVFVTSLPEALKVAGSLDAFIIGGAQVFEQSLPQVDKVYATEIDAEVEGDTFFPVLSENEWDKSEIEHHTADEKNEYGYTFVTYERKGE